MATLVIDTSDLRRLARDMEDFSQRRMKYAVVTALTRTAKAVREGIREKLPQYIDRPVPYTQRGIFFRSATPETMQARVWYNDEWKGATPQARYLYPQIHGGGRSIKRFERAVQAKLNMPPGWYAVPTKHTKLDQYGNIARGQIQQILAQVGTELVAGHSRTMRPTKKNGKMSAKTARAYDKAGGQFVAVPQQKGKLQPGIYQAEGRYFGAKLGYGRKAGLKAILLFKQRVSYRERFPFYDLGRGIVEREIGKQLQQSISESAQRLAARRAGGN